MKKLKRIATDVLAWIIAAALMSALGYLAARSFDVPM